MMQDNKNGENGGNGYDNNGKNEDNSSRDDDNIISFAEMRAREKAAEEDAIKRMRRANAHPPAINLPPVTKLLIIINLVVFALTHFASAFTGTTDFKLWTFMTFGFVPGKFTGLADFGSPFSILSPLTHMFLHSGWLHIGMNVAMFAAFGTGVEKAFGEKRFIAFYLACGLLGALGHALLDPASPAPVVGASGAISGLFAAVLVVFQKAGALGQGKYGLWPFIALWCFISFLFAAVGGMGVGNIAWAAHLGGFFGGFALMRLKYFRI